MDPVSEDDRSEENSPVSLEHDNESYEEHSQNLETLEDDDDNEEQEEEEEQEEQEEETPSWREEYGEERDEAEGEKDEDLASEGGGYEDEDDDEEKEDDGEDDGESHRGRLSLFEEDEDEEKERMLLEEGDFENEEYTPRAILDLEEGLLEEDAYGRRPLTEADRKMELVRLFREEMDIFDQLTSMNVDFQKRIKTHLEALNDEKAFKIPLGSHGQEFEQEYASQLNRIREARLQFQDRMEEKENILEEHRSRLVERDSQTREFHASFLDFKREIATEAVFARTGKRIPSRTLAQLEEQEARKDEEVKILRLENIKEEARLKRLTDDLTKKEQVAPNLHYIDFEQQKLENQQLHEKIEERNEELLKLRKKITNTVHILTHINEKVHFIRSENQELKKELGEMEEQVTSLRDRLTKQKKERDTTKSDNIEMRQDMPLVGSLDLLHDFEMRKSDIVRAEEQITQLRDRYDRIVQRIYEYKQTLGVK